MNWSDQINRFETLTRADVPLFAPPTEMEQAISIYNRAIINLHQDSQDIALIALRRLASTYPLFPHPAFLLGCLLARSGKRREAAELIDQALSAALPEDLQEEARKCLAYVHVRHPETAQPAQGQDQKTAQDGPGTSPAAIGASQILERTRRHGRVRMASSRERQNILRGSEFPEEKVTRVRQQLDPVELLRIGLPMLAAVVLVISLVLIGIRWIPALSLQIRGRQDDAAKLSWLLARLEPLAAADKDIADLLAAYQSEFEPAGEAEPTGQTDPSDTQKTDPAPTTTGASATPTPTPGPTPAPTPTQPPPTPSPTQLPSPTPDPAAAALLEAAAALEAGRTLLQDDLGEGGMALLQARLLLSDIPDETTADDVPVNAAQLRRETEALISEIAVSAANALRLKAMPLFNSEAYEEAFIYFQAAYELNPRAYGGGVAYYLGRCHQLLGRPDQAKEYYEFVIEQFAGRDIASSAAYRIREMGY